MSSQIITFKKKHPSDATRTQRRRTQRRRAQAARQQRWTDASGMVKAVISNILTHDEDQVVREELEAFCKRTALRVKSKQTDEQIILKAVTSGCWTVEDIQDETGFTKPFIAECLKQLQNDGKVIYKNNLYQSI